jgi:hypothetical protein
MAVIEDLSLPTEDSTMQALEVSRQGMQNFSEAFIRDHGELLPERVGVVAMVGITKDLELVSVEDPDVTYEHAASLSLDGRQMDNPGTFIWQATETHTHGRTVSRLYTGSIMARTVEVDLQGRVRSKAEVPELYPQIAHRIQRLLREPLVIASIDTLKDKRQAAFAEVDKFIAENQARLHPKLLNKLSEQKSKSANRRGFPAVAPQYL